MTNNILLFIKILRLFQKLAILIVSRVLIYLQLFLALFNIIFTILSNKPIKGVNLKSQPKKEVAFLNRKQLRRYFIAILKLTGVKGQQKSNIYLSLIPIIQKH